MTNELFLAQQTMITKCAIAPNSPAQPPARSRPRCNLDLDAATRRTPPTRTARSFTTNHAGSDLPVADVSAGCRREAVHSDDRWKLGLESCPGRRTARHRGFFTTLPRATAQPGGLGLRRNRHSYNRHPAWDGTSCQSCYQAEELDALEGIIPGIARLGLIRTSLKPANTRGRPGVKAIGRKPFAPARRLDDCLTGCRR